MYAVATHAIAAADADELRRRQRLDARDAPVQGVDALVAQLEALHLEGRKRVPASLQPALDALGDLLPEALRPELHAGITITHLLDQLFDLQEALLERRVGAARRSIVDLEGPASLPTAS